MMQRSGIEGLEHAQASVRAAIERWDAADLSSMESLRELLEQAASELRCFNQSLEHGAVGKDPRIRSRVTGLKEYTAHLLRLVDACTAFHRGLALRFGNSAPAYTPSGGIAGATEPAHPGLQA